MRCSIAFLLFILLSAVGAPSQVARDRVSPDPNMPRPIEAYDSVFLEELTWLEVRDAMRAGKDTVIVAGGGVEMNGPYLALGKHQYILWANTEAIARKLGNALVAPLVQFVPEGNIRPPSRHMRYPGTISLRQETFQALLTDIAESLRTHGFQHVIFLSDSGDNVAGMTAVAEDLSKKWASSDTSIHYIPEFYKSASAREFLESQGIHETNEGHHDNVASSTQMMIVDPTMVRMKQRIAAGKTSINGVDIAPPKGIEIGKKIVEYRANLTVSVIRQTVPGYQAKNIEKLDPR